jgi:hypothetical protein
MHACNVITLDQVLSVRDGGLADAAAVRHIEQCAACARELARLRSTQAALKSLPQLEAPEYDAAALQARARAPVASRVVAIAAAASVAMLAVLAAVVFSNRPEHPVTDTTLAASDAMQGLSSEPELHTLVIRSQELESYLQRMPRRPYVERAGTSITIYSLQDSIQWVDYQLSLASDVGMTDRQAARLWQDRVRLMDSLVKVRYAEAQRAAYFIPTSGSTQ